MASRRRATSKNRKKQGSGFGKAFATLFLLLLLGAAGTAAYVWYVPFGPSQPTFVQIVPGSSSAKIGRELEEAGIIRTRFAFDAMRWLRPGKLIAGTYRFTAPARVETVYDRIHRGDVYTIAVTIPEGSNIFDIASRLEQAGFGPAADFLTVAKNDTNLIGDLDPKATSLEGYLFPDTYRLEPKLKPEQIAATMVKRFRAEANRLGLHKNVHDVVTTASLVERETAVDGERPLVASVFENRLAKNMPLMTDPAVIYGLQLEGLWRGTIYESDLKRDTPYNTYIHTGLPPGPVANPGAKSLRAAMQPAHTDYLYFVAAGADPQGKSLFAATLKEHKRNVTGYRSAVKKAGGR